MLAKTLFARLWLLLLILGFSLCMIRPAQAVLLPVITTLNPSSGTIGGTVATLTITGTNFDSPGATVSIAGASGFTVVVNSSTQITVTNLVLPNTPGGTNVVVNNTPPLGLSSLPSTFTVNNASPNIATNGLNPSSGNIFSTIPTLTITGTQFESNATVTLAGATIGTTTVNSATQITLTNVVLGNTPGAKTLTVTNPGGGGGNDTATFTINSIAPSISNLSVNTGNVGTTIATLTITGANFASNATVSFPGATIGTTTLTNATTITLTNVALPSTAGTVFVTVVNPGGGTSNIAPFSVTNPTPSITNITPQTGFAGAVIPTLTITGTGFISSSSVSFPGSTIGTTTVNSATQITLSNVTLPGTAGPYTIDVTNAGPGGGTSNGASFSVTGNPTPSITSLSPSSGFAGTTTAVILTGTGYVSGSTVSFDSVSGFTTTVNSATQITLGNVTLPGTAGGYAVTVTNPTPGGGTSSSKIFTVTVNPTPTITSIAPSSGQISTTATLIISGSGFISTSTVSFPGSTGGTETVNSATQITLAGVTLPGTAGSYTVNVTSPGPGGGTSNGATFTVVNPTPVITTLSPNTGFAGSTLATLTISGTGFVSGATVLFPSSSGGTVAVNGAGTQITVSNLTLPANGGTYNITVTNPGGNTSNNITFTVTSNPIPTITALNPALGFAGSTNQTLTISGTGFLTTAQHGPSSISFPGSTNGLVVVNSDTQITVSNLTLPNAGGNYTINVTNPGPGGGISNGKVFTVNTNPGPSISSLSPNTGTIGSLITLKITGTNFISSSTVSFPNTTGGTVTVNSSTLITVTNLTLPSTAGIESVTVTNPGPGGGTSTGVSFSVNNPSPTISGFSPSQGLAGSTVNVGITGTGFFSGSQISFPGSAGGTTTFDSSTHLTISGLILPSAAGNVNVVVTNAGPGGGTSNGKAFVVNNNVATVDSSDPGQVTVGDPDFLLKVNSNGNKFVDGATIVFNGIPLDKAPYNTRFVSSSSLIATVPGGAESAYIGTAGVYTIAVQNPQGAGSVEPVLSNTIPFTVAPVKPAGSGPNTYSPGLQMFSAPYDYPDLTKSDPPGSYNDIHGLLQLITNGVPSQISGLKLAVWNPLLLNYVLTASQPSDNLADHIELGRGYWARFPDTTPVSQQPVGLIRRGTDATANANYNSVAHQFSITLHSGWNMIGDPYTDAVKVNDLMIELPSGAQDTVDAANLASIISNVLYSYDPDSTKTAANRKYLPLTTGAQNDLIAPYVGYWIFAYTDCTLLVPQP